MVRLFLAEDEIAMRDGIKKHINWAEAGIEFCGEAGDGELAWPAIQELKPDIVITDIKMPFMDGLELSGLIRRELPDTRIVILSGYSEFEYAQAALRLGVTEYLLKPITPRKLREVVTRIAASIEEEKRQQEERVDWLLEEEREKEEHNRRRMFLALVSGNLSSHELLKMAENTGMKLGAPFYRIILIYVSNAMNQHHQETVESLLTSVTESFDSCYLFEHSIDSHAVLFTGKTETDLFDKTELLLKKTASAIESVEDLRYYISIGRPVSHLSEINIAYHDAYRAASHRFFSSPNQIVSADAPIGRFLTENSPNPINTDKALQKGNLSTIWENFLRTGTLQETEGFVEDVFSSLGEENLKSVIFLSYMTMDCYFSMARFLKEMNLDPDEISHVVGDINAVVGSLSSAEDSLNYLTKYLQEVIRIRDTSTSTRNSQVLRNAVEYIDAHYTDSSMSLNMAAAAASLSPNRFSTLFSREMGVTFMEYLIKKRMDLACRLLMTTDLRSFEIADRAGYNDPHYFSATFKKIMGMSPKEYRRRGSAGNEKEEGTDRGNLT